jgi:hypothetical protein
MKTRSVRARGTHSRREALGVGALGLGAVLGGCVTSPEQGTAEAQPVQPPAASGPATQAAAPRIPRGDGRLLTPTISSYIANIRTAQVNPEFLELGKRHILDTLAAAVSCKDLEPAMLGRKYALAKSADAKNGATMLATKERVGLVDAAFGSAMIVHGSEINDFIPVRVRSARPRRRRRCVRAGRESWRLRP